MKQKQSGKNRRRELVPSTEQRFKLALKNSPIMLFEHDRDLRYTWIYNPNPEFGYTADQIIGKTDAELLTPAGASQLTKIKTKVLASGRGARQEVAITVDGRPLHFDLTVEPLHDQDGRVVGLICATFEITKRKALERSLQESRQRYATAERLARLGHFIRDFETDEAFWSPEIYRIFGLDQKNPAPPMSRFLEIVHPDDRDLIIEKARRIRTLGTESIFDYRILRADGDERTIRTVLQPIGDHQLPTSKITGTLQDITRESRLKQRLAAIDLLEREEIFKDLHDTVCQELSGIGFLADSVRDCLAQTSDSVRQDVDKIIASAQRAIYQARNIARSLRPLADQPGSLRTALLELAAYIESIYGVRCQVTANKIPQAMNGFIATQLLLIAREAALNAAKHAAANKIRITIARTPRAMTLRVCDDGKGMVNPANRRTFGGIGIMQSRAQLIEARLNIGPGKKCGTEVVCRLENNHHE